MKRKYSIWIGIFVMMLGSTLYGKEYSPIVICNERLLTFKTGEAKVKENTTYVPLREMGEQLGITVEWEHGKTKLTKEGLEVLELYQNQVLPLKSGVSYIALRDLSEYVGYRISSNSAGTIVRISNETMKLQDEEVFEMYKPSIVKKKEVYLTFDDGPNIHTGKILDLLKQYDMKATFFMLEGNMKRYPEIVKRIVDEGHGVALHGVTHDKNKFYATAQSPLGEMNSANKTLESITGTRTQLVRMPYGSVPYLTNSQYTALTKEGYKVWDWHVDSRDWANRDGKKTYESVKNQLNQSKADGQVVLFHDSKDTTESLKLLLEWCEDNQYISQKLETGMMPKTFKKLK